MMDERNKPSTVRKSNESVVGASESFLAYSVQTQRASYKIIDVKRNGKTFKIGKIQIDTVFGLCVGEFAKKRYARESGISQLVVDKPRGFREERGSEKYSKLVSVNSKPIYINRPDRMFARDRRKFEISVMSLRLIIRDSNWFQTCSLHMLRLSFFSFVFTTCDTVRTNRKNRSFYATNLQNHAD